MKFWWRQIISLKRQPDVPKIDSKVLMGPTIKTIITQQSPPSKGFTKRMSGKWEADGWNRLSSANYGFCEAASLNWASQRHTVFVRKTRWSRSEDAIYTRTRVGSEPFKGKRVTQGPYICIHLGVLGQGSVLMLVLASKGCIVTKFLLWITLH